MTKVIEEYKRFTSDEKLMRAYDARDAFLLWQKIMLNREREEGEKSKAISIAKNLKKSGLDAKFISENTGLNVEEIENL